MTSPPVPVNIIGACTVFIFCKIIPLLSVFYKVFVMLPSVIETVVVCYKTQTLQEPGEFAVLCVISVV
jgi:hypothetical protein